MHAPQGVGPVEAGYSLAGDAGPPEVVAVAASGAWCQADKVCRQAGRGGRGAQHLVGLTQPQRLHISAAKEGNNKIVKIKNTRKKQI